MSGKYNSRTGEIDPLDSNIDPFDRADALRRDHRILNQIESILASGDRQVWDDLVKEASIVGFRKALRNK